MSKPFLQQGAFRIETHPLAFDAEFLGPLGNKTVGGSMRLEVDGEGICLRRKSGAEFSKVRWAELRELTNNIRDKGRFSYYGLCNSFFGEGTTRIRVRLKGNNTEWERLATVFDRLPQDVSGQHCPDCLGPVIENVCKYCGKSYNARQRKRGLLFLLGGVAIASAGSILTASSYNPSTGETIVFIGLIFIGIFMALIGLVGLIFEVRVGKT